MRTQEFVSFFVVCCVHNTSIDIIVLHAWQEFAIYEVIILQYAIIPILKNYDKLSETSYFIYMIAILTLQNILNNKCRVHRCNFSYKRR